VDTGACVPKQLSVHLLTWVDFFFADEYWGVMMTNAWKLDE
jgi:hypothetical protein